MSDLRSNEQGKPLSFRGLAGAMWLEMFLLLLMGNSDTLMLSFVSDQAVAAVGYANQFVTLSLLVLRVVTVGTQVLLAQYLGARMWQDAARVAALSLAINLLVGVVLSIGLWAFRIPLLRLLHVDADVLPAAEVYLAVVGGFLFLQAAVNGATGILRTYGYANEALLASVGMNVLHVIGNGLLIYGLGTIPAMGVTGAAIATVASRWMAMIGLAVMLVRLTPVRIEWKGLLAVRREDIRALLRIGIPAAIETLTYHLVQTMFLSWISLMGTGAVAARQYVMNITMFLTLFTGAFSSASSILVGRMVGGGEYDRAYGQVWRSLGWSLGWVTLLNLAAVMFGRELMSIFSADRQIIEWGTQLLMLNLLLETGKAVSMNIVGALRSVGDAPITVWAGLISMAGISLPAGYLLGVEWGLGLAGIWLATSLDEWLRGLSLLIRWRSRRWQSMTLVTRAGPSVPAK
ncbi:MATE family efflux transporter [Paenibacillus chartarius]|uniref:MATE family efflux transporter n=1 Tax=Paenibacillus chartarius TaxID=747481 RepID=A0ABV6DSA4_9BACL